MKDSKAVATLLRDVSLREHEAKLLKESRHSDVRHEITAERYRRALRVFRSVLIRHRHDPRALDDPLIREVARALGFDAEQLADR